MFKVFDMDPLLVIDLPTQISRQESEQLEIEIKTWLLSPRNIHVLDFKSVQRLDSHSYKSFILYNKSLRSVKKYLYCINVAENIVRQIQTDGMGGVFIFGGDLDTIRGKHVPEKTAVDVSIINPFILATQNIIETQANTKIKPGRPYLRNGEDPFPIEIAGLISINSSSGFKGSVVICFQASTFLKIYSNMIGEETNEITAEIQDGAGEIINIIYGQAKTILNEKGYKLGMALPTVLVGDKLKIRYQSRDISMVIPFESDAGPLFVEILIERN